MTGMSPHVAPFGLDFHHPAKDGTCKDPNCPGRIVYSDATPEKEPDRTGKGAERNANGT